ncbi:MAG: vitamin K epoxide reductase family protein [Caldimicrobium sp.]|nr:vitamin K epoxide reductase family protein [Caldimicrobium sp.]MCX7613615.1 vitamin K epoxide reductase family protein [Caldimicrobium sp.]MDW8183094.1 hypothetical protein [Caldimicrobium sp.]
MKKKRKNSLYILLFLLSLTLILILLEYFLSQYDKTLCLDKGCEIARLISPIPKTTLLLIGGLFFTVFLLTTIIYYKTKGSFFKNFLLFLAGSGVFAEAVFISRLLLELKATCYFCISVAILTSLIFIFLLFVIRDDPFGLSSLLSLCFGSIIGFSVAFFLTSLDLDRVLKDTSKGYIIYSENCPRCLEFLKNPLYGDWEKIHLSKVYPLLRALNITTLPVLIERRENQILINTNPVDNATCQLQIHERGGVCVVP